MSRFGTFRKRWLLLIPVALLVVAVCVFAVWASVPVGQPMPEAETALRSDEAVRVDTDGWLVFEPANREPKTGFIFYPGARVTAEAYAPMARDLAESGYLAVITPMPLNLALLDSDEAAEVIEAYPEIKTWTVGGHSLGGVAAASFAHDAVGAADGLVLLASYPQDSDDLSNRDDLVVASVYGTRDGLASPQDMKRSAKLLPPNTRFVAIEGGNHAGFGWYGPQPGDDEPTVSREEQQVETVTAILGVLEETEKEGR